MNLEELLIRDEKDVDNLKEQIRIRQLMKKNVIDAYLRIRTNDQVISNDTLDFMKNASILKLDLEIEDRNRSIRMIKAEYGR